MFFHHLIDPFIMLFLIIFLAVYYCILSFVSAWLMQSCLVLGLVQQPSICTFLFPLKTFGLIDFFFREIWMPHKQPLINQVSFSISSGSFTGIKPVSNSLIFFWIYGTADSMSAVAAVLYITLPSLLTINRVWELEGNSWERVSGFWVIPWDRSN